MKVIRAMLPVIFLLLLASPYASTQSAAAPNFKLKKIKFPGASGTSAYGINNFNVVVGQYFIVGVATHGFVLDHGRGTTLDDPNGTDTLCRGINSSGDIVGVYTSPSGNNHGFLLKDGVYTEITPGALSAASGINDKGEIVGSYTDCQFCQQHAFLWKDGQFQQLDVPGAMYTGASSINNGGVIAIIAPDLNNHFHSYLYENGVYSEIKIPGADETFVESINNLGDLAVSWKTPNSVSHAAFYHAGTFYKVGPDNITVYPFGLNDSDVMVGSYFGIGISGAFAAAR